VYERYLTYRSRLEHGADKPLWRTGRGGHPCPTPGTSAEDLSPGFAGFLDREIPAAAVGGVGGSGGATGRVYEVVAAGMVEVVRRRLLWTYRREWSRHAADFFERVRLDYGSMDICDRYMTDSWIDRQTDRQTDGRTDGQIKMRWLRCH
jgi:hypothetical protein